MNLMDLQKHYGVSEEQVEKRFELMRKSIEERIHSAEELTKVLKFSSDEISKFKEELNPSILIYKSGVLDIILDILLNKDLEAEEELNFYALNILANSVITTEEYLSDIVTPKFMQVFHNSLKHCKGYQFESLIYIVSNVLFESFRFIYEFERENFWYNMVLNFQRGKLNPKIRESFSWFLKVYSKCTNLKDHERVDTIVAILRESLEDCSRDTVSNSLQTLYFLLNEGDLSERVYDQMIAKDFGKCFYLQMSVTKSKRILLPLGKILLFLSINFADRITELKIKKVASVFLKIIIQQKESLKFLFYQVIAQEVRASRDLNDMFFFDLFLSRGIADFYQGSTFL